MSIKNQFFDINNICCDDLLICAIGFEERSFYFLDTVEQKISASNKLVVTYLDYDIPEKTKDKIKQIKENAETTVCEYEYHDTDKAVNCILEFIKEKIAIKQRVVHIDYTSMPRSWFSKLAFKLREIDNCVSKFWYAEGIYPEDYSQYPGAGIDQFMLFSGKPTLRIDKRVHIFGLSYDYLRTQAMISILDPESYITCYATNSNNPVMKNNLKLINQQIIAQSRLSTALHLEDFESMIEKLCEIVADFVAIGDVVLVPDGPKPLIMAMSLIPNIVNLPGVSCLHVSRNKKFFKPINVTATGSVIGFSFE